MELTRLMISRRLSLRVHVVSRAAASAVEYFLNRKNHTFQMSQFLDTEVVREELFDISPFQVRLTRYSLRYLRQNMCESVIIDYLPD